MFSILFWLVLGFGIGCVFTTRAAISNTNVWKLFKYGFATEEQKLEAKRVKEENSFLKKVWPFGKKQ